MTIDPSRVVGYVRVSTTEQGQSGAGLDAQEDAIRREVERRGWELLHIYCDVASGKSRDKRPELAAALAEVAEGRAGTLMVYKLDRLSRSVVDFGTLVDEARSGGWNIVIVDLGVDLSTPAGELVASVMASLAQWERKVISQRTRDALESRRRAGVRLGRPVSIDPDTEAVIVKLREGGAGYRAIGTELTRLGITPPRGGQWYASTVKAVLDRLGRIA